MLEKLFNFDISEIFVSFHPNGFRCRSCVNGSCCSGVKVFIPCGFPRLRFKESTEWNCFCPHLLCGCSGDCPWILWWLFFVEWSIIGRVQGRFEGPENVGHRLSLHSFLSVTLKDQRGREIEIYQSHVSTDLADMDFRYSSSVRKRQNVSKLHGES